MPDLNAKDVQDATLKIQAGFRGMMARKAIKTDEPEAEAGATEAAAASVAAEVPTAKAEEGEEEEEMPDLNDADVQAATLKIQAGFKGYKVRKGMKEKLEESPVAEEAAAATVVEAAPAAPEEEEEMPDLEAKDVQDATLKIQAGFRGMMARKQLKGDKDEGGEGDAAGDAAGGAAEDAEAPPDAPEGE